MNLPKGKCDEAKNYLKWYSSQSTPIWPQKRLKYFRGFTPTTL